MNVLAIIQARGGSKGVPGKNVKSLLGKPLIAWTIEAALSAKSVTRTIVSTDDAAIAEAARAAGAEVPFMRPAELASDDAKSIGLLQHALSWLKKHEAYSPDVVVQLKPTNPLRTADHIDQCVQAYLDHHGVDSVITVVEAPIHPLKTWRLNGEYLIPFIPEEVSGIAESVKMPRQKLPQAFGNNSCVHVINPETIRSGSSIGKKVVGVVLSREESVNIDDPIDFDIAEMLLRRRLA